MSTLANVVTGRLSGGDAFYRGVSTDSRRALPGHLFVALRGPSFDAHDFLTDVMAQGAAGALVETPAEIELPQVEVLDTREALGAMAAAWRASLSPKVIGVTGSNGKTTVKEMIASILSPCMATLATAGNFNNDIGLPLTLLRLSKEHRAAVIEIGTSAPGEIASLAQLASPQIGVVTNASAAHLQGLGTVANVVREKGAMFSTLPADGIAIINADDAGAPVWHEMAADRRVLSFGQNAQADFQVSNVRHQLEVNADGTTMLGVQFELAFAGETVGVMVPLAGQHNALNAAAAAAAAWALGVDRAAIVAGLARVHPVGGRLQWHRADTGGCLIDDTYNANPASVVAAIDVLSALPGNGWLVLGDMGELGENPQARHAAIGEQARHAGVSRLFSLGPMSAHAAAAFGKNGEAFDDVQELIIMLRAHAGEHDHLLVKGSRSARMERVVAALAAPADSAAMPGGDACSST